jgi:biotin transport system substrate-specific component
MMSPTILVIGPTGPARGRSADHAKTIGCVQNTSKPDYALAERFYAWHKLDRKKVCKGYNEMNSAVNNKVLGDLFGATDGTMRLAKQAALVVVGIAILAVAAKIKLPMWPVPITMGTFAVLSIGAAYGARLGLATIFGYMLIGALGFDVFAGSTATKFGLEYMMGGTGGYLVGYVLATVLLGALARKGWDRSAPKMALAMLLGNALIYIPGLIWLGMLYGFDKPILAWGLTPFLVGDVIKLALAAALFPAIWKLVGRARD